MAASVCPSFAQARRRVFGDRGVLVLAENLLERLRPGDEPRARTTELVGRELRCVARALDPDPRRVQLVVRRAAPERRHDLACPPPLGPKERGERRRLGRRRGRLRLGDVVEPVEEGEVAIAGERLDHRAARGGPLRVELREKRRRFDAVVAEGGDVRREPAREHVEVARRPERTPDPAELGRAAARTTTGRAAASRRGETRGAVGSRREAGGGPPDPTRGASPGRGAEAAGPARPVRCRAPRAAAHPGEWPPEGAVSRARGRGTASGAAPPTTILRLRDGAPSRAGEGPARRRRRAPPRARGSAG